MQKFAIFDGEINMNSKESSECSETKITREKCFVSSQGVTGNNLSLTMPTGRLN